MDAEDTCEKYAGEAVEPAKLSQTPLKLDARGLIPVVVQQWDTGEVLMVAWANQEAVRLTFETGTTWFWSRSRQELWNTRWTRPAPPATPATAAASSASSWDETGGRTFCLI